MDEQKPTDPNDLIQFIAATVQTMRHQMAAMRREMATGTDLANLRDQMATKADLQTLREQMATKSDLRRIEEKMDAGFTAVKGDFERVELRLDQDQPELVRMLGPEA